jgi:hypothetical protein
MIVAFTTGEYRPSTAGALKSVKAEGESEMPPVKLSTTLWPVAMIPVKAGCEGGGIVPWREMRKY